MSHRVPVANELEQLGGDERHGLHVVQAQPARQPLLRENAGLVDDQFVDLPRGQMHRSTAPGKHA
jgi:hypothetical protein